MYRFGNIWGRGCKIAGAENIANKRASEKEDDLCKKENESKCCMINQILILI